MTIFQERISRKTIMIVDDDIDMRRLVRLVLTKADYDVVEAADGAEAIAIMKQDSQAPKIAPILCDLQMPNVTGAEVIAYLKTCHPTVPFIVLTAHREFLLTEVLAKQGVCDYLIKPVSEKKLLEVIRTAVRLHELRKQQTLR